MADKSIDICPTFYKEDIATSGSGTVLIGQPATIWDLSLVLEITGSPVVSFSDDANGYNPAHRIAKSVFTGPDTESVGTSKGLNVTRGLSCISNLAGVDIYGIYE